MNIRSLAAPCLVSTALFSSIAATGAEQKSADLYNESGEAIGTVTLTDAPKGVILRIEANGLPAGWHGMHFHETGNCQHPEFKSAGGHVHHSSHELVHGLLNPEANDAGDLPNVYVNEDGSLSVELYSTYVGFNASEGRTALMDEDGAALIIHVNPDDYSSQPIGGAGARIACAVIKEAS